MNSLNGLSQCIINYLSKILLHKLFYSLMSSVLKHLKNTIFQIKMLCVFLLYMNFKIKIYYALYLCNQYIITHSLVYLYYTFYHELFAFKFPLIKMIFYIVVYFIMLIHLINYASWFLISLFDAFQYNLVDFGINRFFNAKSCFKICIYLMDFDRIYLYMLKPTYIIFNCYCTIFKLVYIVLDKNFIYLYVYKVIYIYLFLIQNGG